MLFHTPLYIFFSRRGNCRYNAGARRIAFSDGFIASPRVEKPCRKTGVFGAEKRKLVFRAFIPHLGKEKICLTYFEICQTYFKIQGTYFFSPELPLKHAPKRQTKRRHVPAGAGDQLPFGRKTVCLRAPGRRIKKAVHCLRAASIRKSMKRSRVKPQSEEPP